MKCPDVAIRFPGRAGPYRYRLPVYEIPRH